jgi:hypothetical protein
MSNTFQSISSGSAILKNVYQGPIIDLINEEIPVYRAAEKVKQGWSGLQIVRPLRTVRGMGIGATTDGGTLPKVGASTTVQAIIPAKYNYLRFGVTGPMIKASQNDIGSFVRSAAFELKMGYMDLKTDINRQLCFDGTATVATVSVASTASNSLTIAGRTAIEPALKYIDVGFTFDVIRSSAVVYPGVTVVAITSGNQGIGSPTATITLDQPISCLTTDTLVRANAFGNEIQGLFYALDGGSTTVYGVNRSQALAYQGNVTNATTLSSSQLSLSMLQNIFNEGLRRGNIGKYNAIYSDFQTLAYYQKLLTPDKRYSNTMEGDGSFGNKGEFYLEFNGIAWVPDKDMPGRIAMLPAEVLKLYVLCELEFSDEWGSMYIPQNDADSFEVRLRHFSNLFNEQPASCAVLTNFTSP